MTDQLKEFYAEDGPERIGFILQDDTIVECDNLIKESKGGFDFAASDLIKYGLTAKASWHTHPGLLSNLSFNDQESFVMWPDMLHYIVGRDGIRVYKVERNRVIQTDGPA